MTHSSLQPGTKRNSREEIQNSPENGKIPSHPVRLIIVLVGRSCFDRKLYQKQMFNQEPGRKNPAQSLDWTNSRRKLLQGIDQGFGQGFGQEVLKRRNSKNAKKGESSWIILKSSKDTSFGFIKSKSRKIKFLQKSEILSANSYEDFFLKNLKQQKEDTNLPHTVLISFTQLTTVLDQPKIIKITLLSSKDRKMTGTRVARTRSTKTKTQQGGRKDPDRLTKIMGSEEDLGSNISYHTTKLDTRN